MISRTTFDCLLVNNFIFLIVVVKYLKTYPMSSSEVNMKNFSNWLVTKDPLVWLNAILKRAASFSPLIFASILLLFTIENCRRGPTNGCAIDTIYLLFVNRDHNTISQIAGYTIFVGIIFAFLTVLIGGLYRFVYKERPDSTVQKKGIQIFSLILAYIVTVLVVFFWPIENTSQKPQAPVSQGESK